MFFSSFLGGRVTLSLPFSGNGNGNLRHFSSDCINNKDDLNPYFVTGLTEAEGSFSITKHKDTRAKFE